ncbi:MAG: GGDEF domain-containing protein [Anaerolineales bacterium]|jgi:diguanylate cyclase (GGDEF)-like protein|nr:GGDEF domain-containing protein [Anaerolineales bacterium]
MTVAAALLATLVSMLAASAALYLIEGAVSPIGLLLSGVIPFFLAPFSLYNNFKLVHRLDATEDQLRLLSHTDDLTQTFNRRYFMEHATYEFDRSQRYNSPFSIAIMDLDNFKDINDSHSHLAGDAALKHVAQLCLDNLRQMDIFARYGGDEFVFLFPETNAAQAEECLLRILNAISCARFEFDGQMLPVRASIGVSICRDSMPGFDDLLREADFALYAAKRQGGMRVIAHPT